MHDIENCCSFLYICLWLFKYTKTSAVFFYFILTLSLEMSDDPYICLLLLVIYPQQINRQFQLDIDRHNAQYAPIDVETFRLSHDRFLCIGDDVYHIGASIKDLGKKWFGFSKMEILTPDELVERINRG